MKADAVSAIPWFVAPLPEGEGLTPAGKGFAPLLSEATSSDVLVSLNPADALLASLMPSGEKDAEKDLDPSELALQLAAGVVAPPAVDETPKSVDIVPATDVAVGADVLTPVTVSLTGAAERNVPVQANVLTDAQSVGPEALPRETLADNGRWLRESPWPVPRQGKPVVTSSSEIRAAKVAAVGLAERRDRVTFDSTAPRVIDNAAGINPEAGRKLDVRASLAANPAVEGRREARPIRSPRMKVDAAPTAPSGLASEVQKVAVEERPALVARPAAERPDGMPREEAKVVRGGLNGGAASRGGDQDSRANTASQGSNGSTTSDSRDSSNTPAFTARRAERLVVAEDRAETSLLAEEREVTPVAPPDPPDERVARVEVDADLAVEVTTRADEVDVVLDGTIEAIRPLADMGRELESSLSRSGFSLNEFSTREREGGGGGAREGGSRSHAREAEAKDSSSNPVRVRRGAHVNRTV